MSELGPRARRVATLTFATAVTLAGLLLLLEPGDAALPGLLLLAGVVLVTELRPVHVSRGSERQSFTLTEGPLVVALAVAPGSWVVTTLVAAVGLAQLHRRLPSYKTAFNTAQFGVASAVACFVAQRVTGDLGVLLGITAFVVINDALVRLVLHVATGARVRRPLSGASWPWALHVVAITSTALLASHTYRLDPGVLPAFAAPAVLILWSQEQSTRRRALASVSTALAEQARKRYAAPMPDRAALVARTVRDLLAAAEVELLVLDGARVARTFDSAARTSHSSLEHDALSQGWAADALAQPAGVRRGHWVGVAIGGDSPTAVLGAWRAETEEPFTQADLMLLSALAHQTAVWLVPADDALPEPALLDLHVHATEASGALDALRAVRVRLQGEGGVVPLHQRSLAEDLLAAEEKLARFLSGLVTAPVADDLVVIGTWRTA